MKYNAKRIAKRVTKINRKIKIHKEGRAILVSLFVLLVGVNIVFYFWHLRGLGFIINFFFSLITFGFFLYFFRNPMRLSNIDDNCLIVAPADGRIVAIEPVDEYEYFGGKKMMQVSIFMSVFSVHANWYPINNGIVKYIKHHNGKHLVAYLPKSSHENERATTVIEAQNGQEILVRQIAGALARRIVTYASVGHISHIDSHLGFIKFGSRVDVLLPVGTEIFVSMNESTKANQTIIARLAD